MPNEQQINELEEAESNQQQNGDLGFKNSLNYILENYGEVSRNTSGVSIDNYDDDQKELFDLFVYDFPEFLKNLSSSVSERFNVSWSHREGRLMILPYYGFAFEDENDFYVYYLFSYDSSEIYLTLGLKTEKEQFNIIKTKEIFKRLIIDCYENQKDLDFKLIDDVNSVNLKVKDLYNNSSENNFDRSEKERLKRQLGRAENYENATIFAIKYEKDNLPPDEELINDLHEFLKLYKFVKEKNIFSNIDTYKPNHNLIYFGAPGTGKSHLLNKEKELFFEGDNYERITFHPDYSYANFVGTYKPVSDDEDKIRYKYVPGPFMRVLSKAIDEENNDMDYLLIIEEINRANVAAVFGDVFQLLDRDENNCSKYEINVSDEAEVFIKKKKIKIPSNMYIWATMNSADQGVFAMDSAFKRRWNFKYLDINNDQHLIENLKFTLNGDDYYWNELRKSINRELLKYGVNEDKLIGPFFAFNDFVGEEIIPSSEFKKTFKNKILMYLFEDVAKHNIEKLFSGTGIKNITFGQLCQKFNDDALGIFCESIRDDNHIKVKNMSENETSE